MITPIIVPMTVSSSRVQIPMSVSVDRVRMRLNVATAYKIVDGDWYDGETVVDPLLFESTVLGTKNKLMPDDVTVTPIQILDVDNPYGGYTVTIGKVRN